MLRQWLLAAATLVLLTAVGNAGASEYNSGGRDMYGNTAAQNEAVRLRGAQEKALYVGKRASRAKAENDAWLYSLIPGAIFLAATAIAGVLVARRSA